MPDNLPAGLKFLVLDLEKVNYLWEQFSKIKGFFDDYSSQERFIQDLVSPNSIWLECMEFPGILYANNIVVGLSASVHFAFFDRKLRGREVLLIDAIKYLIAKAQLRKINAFVPAFAEQLIRFIKNALGFTQEGVIRRCSTLDGMPFDMVVLGITNEEVFDGRVLSTNDTGTSRDETVGVDK